MANVNAIRVLCRVRPVLAVFVLAGLAAGCASPPPPFPDLPRLRVSLNMSSRNLCGLGVSPPINVSNAPPTTTQYRLRMTNLDVLFQQPWQTTVEAKPGALAEGAIADYQAPCVGDLQVYSFVRYQQYRLEVLALDAQNQPVAYGAAVFPVQSVSTLQGRERGQARAPVGVPVINPPGDVVGPTMAPIAPNIIGPRVDPTLVPQIINPRDQP